MLQSEQTGISIEYSDKSKIHKISYENVTLCYMEVDSAESKGKGLILQDKFKPVLMYDLVGIKRLKPSQINA